MVEAAGDVESRVGGPAGHHFGRHQSRPGAEGRRIVHPGIERVVPLKGEVEPPRLLPPQSLAQVPHRGDVLRGMEPLQLPLLGLPGSKQDRAIRVERAVSVQQVVGVAQTHRAHRVVGPKLMPGHCIVVNEGGSAHIDSSPAAGRVSAVSFISSKFLETRSKSKPGLRTASSILAIRRSWCCLRRRPSRRILELRPGIPPKYAGRLIRQWPTTILSWAWLPESKGDVDYG